MTRFALVVNDDGVTCDVQVAGDVDVASADELTEIGLLGLRMDPIRTLVIDLGGVTFLDSTGLGALVALRNQALELGTDLLLRHVPDSVRRILQITALDVVFMTADELGSSLAAPFVVD